MLLDKDSTILWRGRYAKKQKGRENVFERASSIFFVAIYVTKRVLANESSLPQLSFFFPCNLHASTSFMHFDDPISSTFLFLFSPFDDSESFQSSYDVLLSNALIQCLAIVISVSVVPLLDTVYAAKRETVLSTYELIFHSSFLPSVTEKLS